MDFTPVIAQLSGMLAWFIPAVFLIAQLKSPWAKGHFGELLVRVFAHRQLDEQTYHRLHNVTLNTPDGTTQIDHVFLSIYGTLVLETKKMNGWIFARYSPLKAEVPSLATQRKHAQNLVSDLMAKRRCPKCGNAPLISTVNSGRKQEIFLAKFPKCRTIQDL